MPGKPYSKAEVAAMKKSAMAGKAVPAAKAAVKKVIAKKKGMK